MGLDMWQVITNYLQELSKLLDIPADVLEIYVSFVNEPQCLLTTANLYRLEPSSNGHVVYYTVNRNDLGKHKGQITSFGLAQLTGCCGICVSTAAYVYEQYRKKGVNKLTNRFRQTIARHAGYGLLLCTDIANNTPEKRTLLAEGWQDIFRFTNPRTSRVLDISVKVL